MSSRTPHRGVGGSPVRPKDTKKVSDIMEVGGASEGEDDIEAEEVESGQRFTKKLGDPRMPCEAEVKEHEFTHLPIRSWCRHCVRGKGKGDAPTCEAGTSQKEQKHWASALWGRRRRAEVDDAGGQGAEHEDDDGVGGPVQ